MTGQLMSMDEAQLLKIKATLDHLDDLGVQYQITGSLGMLILGIIDRCPNDLDVIVTSSYRDKILPLEDQPDNVRSITRRELQRSEGNYFPKMVNGVKVCFFEKVVYNTIEKKFMATNYQIANPAYSIEAKLGFLKQRLFLEDYKKDKAMVHAQDIADYWKWILKVGEDNPFTVKVPTHTPTQPSDDDLPW